MAVEGEPGAALFERRTEFLISGIQRAIYVDRIAWARRTRSEAMCRGPAVGVARFAALIGLTRRAAAPRQP